MEEYNDAELDEIFREGYARIERQKQQRKQVRAGMRRFWNGS